MRDTHIKILTAFRKIIAEKKPKQIKQTKQTKQAKQVQQSKEVFEQQRSKFLSLFNKANEYFDKHGPEYTKAVSSFEKSKQPYREYNEHEEKEYEKEYTREHTLEWQENFYGEYPSFVFDRRAHLDAIEEYQKFKAEKTGEWDNPDWHDFIESSDALSALDYLKDLSLCLQSIKIEDLGRINVLLGGLVKLLFGNDEAQGWFYTPEGFSDALYFLNYGLKNYYE